MSYPFHFSPAPFFTASLGRCLSHFIPPHIFFIASLGPFHLIFHCQPRPMSQPFHSSPPIFSLAASTDVLAISFLPSLIFHCQPRPMSQPFHSSPHIFHC